MRDFEKFSNMVLRWRDAYTCAVRSYVELKTPPGTRLLLYGKILFEPWGDGIDPTPFFLETEHLFAAREVIPLKPDGVSNTIENMKTGRLTEKTSLLPNSSSQPFSFYATTTFNPLVTKMSVSGENRHVINTNAGFPDHLEWEVKTADVPFDTVDELLLHCGLPIWNGMGNDNVRIEIVAKAPGIISDTSTIVEGKGVIKFRAAKNLDYSKWKLGCRVFAKDRTISRESALADAFQWHDETDFKSAEYQFSTNDAPALEAYLSYDGVPIDQASVVDPKQHLNPRYSIHQLFDPKFERLHQMLFSPDKDKAQMAQVFEGAVSSLLVMLGFSVTNYGRFRKLQDGPDIIALTPSGNVAIVECTIGLIDQKDKIAKLVQRTQLMNEKLVSSGHALPDIQGVIVTLLTREEIAANINTAREHGIAVVCKENIEGLLNQVALPLNADRCFHDLKKLIPASKKGIFGNLEYLQ